MFGYKIIVNLSFKFSQAISCIPIFQMEFLKLFEERLLGRSTQALKTDWIWIHKIPCNVHEKCVRLAHHLVRTDGYAYHTCTLCATSSFQLCMDLDCRMIRICALCGGPTEGDPRMVE